MQVNSSPYDCATLMLKLDTLSLHNSLGTFQMITTFLWSFYVGKELSDGEIKPLFWAHHPGSGMHGSMLT